jgi:hypothetical protein
MDELRRLNLFLNQYFQARPTTYEELTGLRLSVSEDQSEIVMNLTANFPEFLPTTKDTTIWSLLVAAVQILSHEKLALRVSKKTGIIHSVIFQTVEYENKV